MSALIKYSDYKESDVEWIGSIPATWNIAPGFKIYKENKSKNIGLKVEKVLSLSYGKIVIRPKEKLTGLVPESFETYQIVKPNDIIVRCMDLQNDQTSLRTGLSKDDGIITSAYLNLNVLQNFNAIFLHYYLHSLDTTKVLYKFGSGLRQNLSFDDFKRLPVLVPSKEEQEKIVNFLDTKTAQIDKAIQQKEQLITLLKERQQVLIRNAVTRGLNPNVKMKDSGVEWIGKVPEHWEIKAFKYNAKISTSNHTKGLLLTVNDLNDNYNGFKFINDRFSNQPFGEKGKMIVFPKRGGAIFTNKIKIIDRAFELDPNLMAIKIHNGSIEFFAHLLRQIKLEEIADISSVPQINNKHIYPLLFPFPPVSEQNKIVEYINIYLVKYNEVTVREQKQIEKLKEYKITLIDSVVTGKVKVS